EEIPTSPIDMLASEFGDLSKSDLIKVRQLEIQGRRERIDGEFVKDNHGNMFPKYKTMPN
ncbi:10000_t:CDS:1, partial [Gigaspora rosea]